MDHADGYAFDFDHPGRHSETVAFFQWVFVASYCQQRSHLFQVIQYSQAFKVAAVEDHVDPM